MFLSKGTIINPDEQDIGDCQIFDDKDEFYRRVAQQADSVEEADRICEEYEPYWTKCILVKGYN